MPIELGIYKVSGEITEKIQFTSLDKESKLEKILVKDISILSNEYLLIGKQVKTKYGKVIDLLAIGEDGNLTIIELKKDKTPRDVIAQSLDYATWVKELSHQEIKDLNKKHFNEADLETRFNDKFGISLPEELNQSHDILIVCSSLDVETERIILYLSDNYGVPINAAYFQYFKVNDLEYLTRNFLIDPHRIEEQTNSNKYKQKLEEWNGKDFVVNIGADSQGNDCWSVCKEYGIVSAGGGRWYTNSLKKLDIGHRVFAMIPKEGYVGVGLVESSAVPAKEFKFTNKNGIEVNVADVPCDRYTRNLEDLETCEYVVKVKWQKTIPNDKNPFWTSGLSANQNSAFKLRNKFTLDKLSEVFELDSLEEN